jgi:LacI family transcriptional regulator
VKPELRDRVVDAVERLGYRPNLTARAFATGSTRLVAVIVSDIRDPYYSTIARGIIDRAGAEDFVVTVAGAEPFPEDELAVVREVRALSPSAIILTGSRFHDRKIRAELIDTLSAFAASGGAVVVVGPAGLPFDTVDLDDRGAGRALAAALVERGYRAPAVIGARAGLRAASDRVKGLVEGFAAAGVHIDRGDIDRAEPTRDGGYQAAGRVLDRGSDLDLIVAANDVMAIGAMTAVRDAARTPGSEIALAGFDDIVGATDVSPKLTTVDMRLEAAGTLAVELAIDPAPEPRRRTLAPSVVVRASTPVRN